MNVFTGETTVADIAICEGMIAGIGGYDGETVIDLGGQFVLPGFVDAHVHIESAMVTPPEYARAVVPRGTSAVVADPHEIANVLGVPGVEFMLRTSRNLPLDVHIMASPVRPCDAHGNLRCGVESAGRATTAEDRWRAGGSLR